MILVREGEEGERMILAREEEGEDDTSPRR